MIHIGEFEGIGGFSLAAEWMGWRTLVTSEINPFGQQVLKYYWPNAYHHGDIHTLTYDTINAELTKRFGAGWRNEEIILTGGFPCQPYSTAGKRLGKEDERHLWPEMLRTIREIQPEWVVGENVRGLISWNGGLVFDEVQADLEAEGYEVLPFLLPAASVNAPHERYRIWFVAHSTSNRRQWERSGIEIEKRLQQRPESTGKLEGILEGLRYNGTTSNTNKLYGNLSRFRTGEIPQLEASGVFGDNVANTINEGLQRNERRGTHGERDGAKTFRSTSKPIEIPTWDNWPTEPPVCSRNDGISSKLVGITFSKHRNESIKAYGNAIVPKEALQIFKAIEQYRALNLTTNKAFNT